MPLRRRLKQAGVPLLGLIARALYFTYLRFVLLTSRVEGPAAELLAARKRQRKSTIIGLLHQDLLLAPLLFEPLRPSQTVVNRGDAGGILCGILERTGISAVRGGSSTRSSRRAPVLGELRRVAAAHSETGINTIFTPDGSRGPAGACKAGIALFAIRTQTEVVCISIHARRAWYLPNWDRTMIPAPFTTIRFESSEVMTPPRRLQHKTLEEFRERIESALHRMHGDAFARDNRSEIPPLESLPPLKEEAASPRAAAG